MLLSEAKSFKLLERFASAFEVNSKEEVYTLVTAIVGEGCVEESIDSMAELCPVPVTITKLVLLLELSLDSNGLFDPVLTKTLLFLFYILVKKDGHTQ